MLKKVIYYTFGCCMALTLLDGCKREPRLAQGYTEEDSDDEDVWYGPGFYFGVWFDNEDDYWGWRGNHRDYPSNRHYYNKDHPVHYEGHGGGARGGGHGGGGHR